MKQIRTFAIAALLLATAGVLFTPFAMDNGYSWLQNSISETGGQGVTNAWLGRLTLFLSGTGVLLVVALKRRSWNRTATFAMALFGIMWSLTSFFSTRSWVQDVPFDEAESITHSFLASAMAIVVLGALSLGFGRGNVSRKNRALAFLLAFAATFLPLASLLFPDLAGLFQRLMFLYTYFWFMREARTGC